MVLTITMEEVVSFLASQQPRASEINDTPPILPNNNPAGSLNGASSKTETVADGITASARPVNNSINAVMVRSDFIFNVNRGYFNRIDKSFKPYIIFIRYASELIRHIYTLNSTGFSEYFPT